MRGILTFVLCIAAVGAAMGGVAAGVKNKRVNIFKTQAGAWLVTIIMVTAAIGIGYAKAPANNPAPSPDYPAPTAPPNAVPATPVEDYVRDDAGVLSSRTEQTLNERNIRLMDNYEVLIGVATCNYGGELGGFAQRQFSDMGLGGYDMLVVLDISGDNYWLYTGDSVAWDFSDEDCSDYTYNYMERPFARGDYDTAVLQLTEMLEAWYGTYYA